MRIAAVGRALPDHYYDQKQLLGALERVWGHRFHNAQRLQQLHRNVQVDGRHLALPIDEYEKLDSFTAANDAFVRCALPLGARAVRRPGPGGARTPGPRPPVLPGPLGRELLLSMAGRRPMLVALLVLAALDARAEEPRWEPIALIVAAAWPGSDAIDLPTLRRVYLDRQTCIAGVAG